MINKIRQGNFTVIIRGDKILFCPNGKNGHYTFHFGPRSKVFDGHITVQRKSGKRHKTIFEIPHDDAFRLLLRVGSKILPELKRNYHPLNFKWMVHNKVFAVVMRREDNPDSEKYMTLKNGYHELNMDAILENIWIPEYLDELFSLNDDETFLLFSSKIRGKPKHIGSGFLVKRNFGQKRLVWLHNKHMVRAQRIGEVELERALQAPYKASQQDL